jgi:hypothetical protein
MGEMKNIHKILIGKPEGKKSLGRPRRRWEGTEECILRKEEAKVWTGFFWLSIGINNGAL